MIGFSIILLIIIFYKLRVRQIENHNIELQEKVNEQVAQLKILDGLLPICSYCKKVRDDSGYWESIESYLGAHSEAEFSHAVCPECEVRLYPNLGPPRTE